MTETAQTQRFSVTQLKPTFLEVHSRSESCKDINPTNREAVLSALICFAATFVSTRLLSASTLFTLVWITDTFWKFGLS